MEDNLIQLDDTNKTSKLKGVLGTLKGVFADMKHPTRNGRLYSRECWEKALNSDDVKEKLETRTMFGELDHPEDRLETLQERAAIVVTKLEMDDKNGVVNGEADILDTPFGRILKTFVDAGVKVGISSRGSGEEVASSITEGNEIVPDTFYLETFDVVALPAVKKARLELVESKHKDLITEAFAKEIKQAKSEGQIKELQEYAKQSGIIIKENTSLGGENITPEKEEENDNIDVSSEVISQLEEELNVSNTKCKELENFCNMMKAHSIKVVKDLKETRLANQMLIKEKENLISQKDNFITQIESYKTSVRFLKHRLEESRNTNTQVKEVDTNAINSLKEELNKYKGLVNSLQREKLVLESKLDNNESSLNDSNDTISNLQKDFNMVKEQKANLLADNNKLKNEVKSLTDTNTSLKNLVDGKYNEINTLNDKVSQLSEQLTEFKKANEKLVNEKNLIKESYLKKRASDNNIEASEIKKLLKENYTLSDIDNRINEAIETRNALNNLSYTTLDESVLLNARIRNEDNVIKESKENNNSLNMMAKVIKKSSKN